MTISKLSAGNGYAYYTSVTVSADQKLPKGRELGDYYLETGTPRGVWMGSGAADLGVDGVVTEAQMRALFGEGLHPEADAMVAELVAHGVSAKAALAQVRLGRRFATYQSRDNELAGAIAAAEKRKADSLGRELEPGERRAVRMRQAGIMFHDRHGRSGSPQEVAKLLASELSKGQTAVAGYDLTFSAPKSLSVAWAVSDDPEAWVLEAAHEHAIDVTLRFMEREIIRTRTGAGGVALRTTSGLVATRFRHWESREGDPQLHDHVVIANRVKITDADGRQRWLTIDGQSLYRGTMNASSLYNAALANELKRLGFELRERVTASGQHHGMELACVAEQQLTGFCSRSTAIEAKTRELVAAYVERHGHQPATKELMGIRQQATLETRVPKSQATTRPQLRNTWRAQLGHTAGQLQAKVRAVINGPERNIPQLGVDVEHVAAMVIDEASTKQSTWTQNHIETRINIWAAAQPGIVDDATKARVLDAALRQASIAITPEIRVPEHPELRNEDGTSIYQAKRALLYTSAAVLEAEDRLLDFAREVALPAVTEAHFEAAMAGLEGPALNQGQVDLAHQVACCEQLVTVGIGPAGTGKTTAMRLAVDAAARAGVAVHGVTVSAAAAEQLQQGTSMPATTIAKWLHDRNNGERPLAAGDIVLVDEAGMVSARDLDRICTQAREAGAFVRLIGDDRQLQAIGSGGSLKMLAAEVGAVRLDQVHRFHDEAEAAASLALREHGDVSWYIDSRRVHGAAEANLLAQVVDGWAADEAAGRSSLMMAGTNHLVATLNQLAQVRRVANGEVSLGGVVVDLADGCTAGVGDRIVTRRNDRRMATANGLGFVKNGDLWTITDITPSGDVMVVDEAGRGICLPAEYVAGHTELGYATTVHRAQGRTVDRARIIIDKTTSREALYVGLTRGREANHVYSVTDGVSAVDTLRHAAGNVTQASTARELINQAQAETGHPGQLVRILRDMQQLADRHRYTTIIRTQLPDLASRLLHSDKQARLFAALARAEDHGFAARRILAIVTSDLPALTGDPTGLIVWRISDHLNRSADIQHSERRRPMRTVSDLRLQELIDEATQQRRDAAEQLNTSIHHAENPANQPHQHVARREAPSCETSNERLFELTAAAARFFADQYPGSPAAAYIAGRFGQDLTATTFPIGYAPAGWDTLTRHLHHTLGATAQELIDAGLARLASHGNLIDVFRDRVTFTLHDIDGHPVGFTARCGPAAPPDAPKYINTPATPIFTKGQVLFGLHGNQQALRDGAIPVRVEGPMDAIAITLAGDGRAVGLAPMGTALTDEQVQLIADHTPGRVVLSALDLDPAGQKAAARDFATYTRNGLEARELVLVNQVDDRPIKDPADAYRIDPASLRLALTLPEIAPSMAAQVIRTRLTGDPHLNEHIGARAQAAHDLGRIIAQLPPDSWAEETASAAAALAHYAQAPGTADEFRASIMETAIRTATGWSVDSAAPHPVQVGKLLSDLAANVTGPDRAVLTVLRRQLDAQQSDWTKRRHGALSDAQLSNQLHNNRRTLATLDRAIAEIHQTRRQDRLDTHQEAPTGPCQAGVAEHTRRADVYDQRLAKLTHDRRTLLRATAELRQETQLRRTLDPGARYEEQTQREALNGAPAGIAPVDVDRARQRWQNASEVQRELLSEQRLRTFDPDLSINTRPATAPGWAVPGRGLHDPATPPSWTGPLTEMAETVTATINQRGAALAIQPPQWATNYLADVPESDSPIRRRWEHLAGQIETWRHLTNHTDPAKALPTPKQSQDASHQADRDLHVLHTAASDLRRDIERAQPVVENEATFEKPETAHRGSTERTVGAINHTPIDAIRQIAARALQGHLRRSELQEPSKAVERGHEL